MPGRDWLLPLCCCLSLSCGSVGCRQARWQGQSWSLGRSDDAQHDAQDWSDGRHTREYESIPSDGSEIRYFPAHPAPAPPEYSTQPKTRWDVPPPAPPAEDLSLPAKTASFLRSRGKAIANSSAD